MCKTPLRIIGVSNYLLISQCIHIFSRIIFFMYVMNIYLVTYIIFCNIAFLTKQSGMGIRIYSICVTFSNEIIERSLIFKTLDLHKLLCTEINKISIRIYLFFCKCTVLHIYKSSFKRN